ncbi:MAG TPA: hypothetical protein VL242_42130 [Sorangium sp.]|nr:hypothetical protein [Sorangium sp.]
MPHGVIGGSRSTRIVASASFGTALDIEDGPGRTIHAVAQLSRRQIEPPWASPMLLAALCGAHFTSLLVHTRHGCCSRPSLVIDRCFLRDL